MTEAQSALIDWYRHNKRELPWRRDRDPYRIWISETMLQQTTTTAVIPFFERFIARFPNLVCLARAKTEAVVEVWAGLGYYSRARNLHKSAQALHKRGGFPRTHAELIELPGFGPYTARAVSSLAFDENVGVVDGNVIRVLARLEGADWDWWQGKTRTLIQARADAWVEGVSSYDMNQALMELGRTICMPKSPTCMLCPIHRHCRSLADGQVGARPKPKPRRTREIWQWEPSVTIRDGQILIRRNDSAPFLRGQWLLPGAARKLASKPKTFDYRHSITHHDIFVTVRPALRTIDKSDKWVPLDQVRQHVPASLVQKALAHFTAATDNVQTHARSRTAPRK